MTKLPTFPILTVGEGGETHAAGSPIFVEGDTGECMFVVEEGEVDLVVAGNVVETVGKEGVFGEMALIEGGPRSASAVARVDARVTRIDERQFEFMTRNTPHFAVDMLRLVCGRLRQMDAASRHPGG